MVQYLAIKVGTYFADTQNTPTQPKRVERGNAKATQDVPSVPAAEGIPTEECSEIAKLNGARLNFPAVTASNFKQGKGMEEKRRAPRFLAKWLIKCLCNCTIKEEKKIYQGVSRDVSALGVSMVSNYNICAQKALSVQLTIPGLHKGDQDNVLYIGSRTTYTVVKDGSFITGIEFLQFEQDGAQLLREHLEKRFAARV